jgi:hypothetical protein
MTGRKENKVNRHIGDASKFSHDSGKIKKQISDEHGGQGNFVCPKFSCELDPRLHFGFPNQIAQPVHLLGQGQCGNEHFSTTHSVRASDSRYACVLASMGRTTDGANG